MTFVRAVELVEGGEGYPWDLPAVRALDGRLELHPKVTYLIGENGSGKSTLLEAIAVAAGMNPEGGSSQNRFATRDSHSELSRGIRLIRGTKRPATDFFLRAESLYTVATYVDEAYAGEASGPKAFGGRSLHEQSHGESFLAVVIERFGAEGLYVLDEPEAALSTQNCLTLLRRMHELVGLRSQFVIATHSPLVLAYPDALILRCGEDGLEPVAYDDAEPVTLTRSFLDAPERFLRALMED